MLHDEFERIFRFSCVVGASSESSDVVVAPYNTCFALRQLIEHADCVIPVDNDALQAVAEKGDGRRAAAGERRRRSSGGAAAAFASGLRSGAPLSSDANFSVAEPTKRKQAAFDTMNAIAAQMLSNLTCSMRFPGQQNMDIGEITTTSSPISTCTSWRRLWRRSAS